MIKERRGNIGAFSLWMIMKNSKWENYDAYLQSPEWAKIRGMVLDRAKHRCQACNSNNKLHVHHRVYDCRWGEESTDDLIALCQSCHGLFHAKEKKIRAANKAEKKAVIKQASTKVKSQKSDKKKKALAKVAKSANKMNGRKLTAKGIDTYTLAYGLPKLLY